ncbi:hypothetical protein J1F21_21045 [Aeromonas veronii]|uniref:hypothetical protein n=1 Tax=Aeromonas veronii TaxID=654 RepID=UPI001A8F3694|nr:hypothetical protein [Aeromonas veronii]MBO0400776.1 hypothetical protein [Aeromonas veronii]
MDEKKREPRKYPLLGAAAYLLIPGERRKKAAVHFRKAGFEAVKGVAALARPEKPPENDERQARQRINIE